MNIVTKSLPRIKVSFHRNSKGIIGPFITDSTQVHELFKSVWNTGTIELFEEFKVLYLDRRNCVMGWRNLCRGTSASTLVNIKLLVGIALECNAEGIILCHNHPSGNDKPSEIDKVMTRKVKQACELFDIKLLDHLILTKDGYTSLSDSGLLL